MSNLDPSIAGFLQGELQKSKEAASELLPTNDEGEIDPKAVKLLDKVYNAADQFVAQRTVDTANYENKKMAFARLGLVSWQEHIHPEMQETANQVLAECDVAMKLACSNNWTSRESIIKSQGYNR